MVEWCRSESLYDIQVTVGSDGAASTHKEVMPLLVCAGDTFDFHGTARARDVVLGHAFGCGAALKVLTPAWAHDVYKECRARL